MRLALIVTTYERPDALARVLATVAAQSGPPDELHIADDGSGPATSDVIEAFRHGSPFPVYRSWLAHDGFQAGRMRNRAIAGATADYIVLVDGDMLLHRDFLADHRRAARPGHWIQGTRILLDDAATRRALESSSLPDVHGAGVGIRRRLYGWHSPTASRRLGRLANGWIAVKACNQGFWRGDLLRVNGFDQALSGWGSEDKELCARLANAGVRRRTLLFGGIAFHLAHAPADRSSHERNRAALERTRVTGRTWCEHGIMSPPTPKETL